MWTEGQSGQPAPGVSRVLPERPRAMRTLGASLLRGPPLAKYFSKSLLFEDVRSSLLKLHRRL